MTKIDPVEFDVDMDRAYIPVNTRYEIQTKGKGSSFRIANIMTHERWLITDKHLHPMLTELAYGTHAELTQAQSKIEMLEAKLKFQDEWLSNGVYYTTDEAFKLHDDYNTKIAELTAKLDKARENTKLALSLLEVNDMSDTYLMGNCITLAKQALELDK